MSFAQNLIYIRQHYGVTQETIAEQLGVSRQTVSKWEAGINFPETDKLLLLCDLYHTNLDDLMRGSVQIANTKDTELYDAHMNRFGWGIVGGVILIIFGMSILMILEGMSVAENVSTAIMLSFIVVGVLIIVVSGLNHTEFKRRNANIEPSYSDEVLAWFGKRFTVLMAVGLGIIMLDVIMLIAATPEEGDFVDFFGATIPYMTVTAVFMIFLAFGVGTIIYAGMQKSKYDQSEFTYVSADGSTKRKTGSMAPREVTPEELKRNHIVGSLCGAIMVAATIAFFVISFWGSGWPIDKGALRETGFAYGWISFVIGGLLCAIVAIVGNMVNKSKDELISEAQKENPWVKIEKKEEDQGAQ